MTYVATIGRAFKTIEPVEGNVRIYQASDESHWVGHDTEEVFYYDNFGCMSEHLRTMFGPHINKEIVLMTGTYVHLSSARRSVRAGGAPIVYAITADFGAWPAPDWPDYDVHCGNCETLLHEGGE